VIAVVLAAGAGARLGGVAKALLPRGDTTFLGAIAATCAAAGVGELLVVVGAPFAAAVAEEAARLGARVVVNPDPGRGMASSVATGFAACGGAHRAALLWPVDHPAVTAATVGALLVSDADVVVPRHRGAGGHPVAVARAVWPALAACGDLAGGAREVLRDRRWRRRDLEVDDPGVVRDVDHPLDLPDGCAG
jgi:CTP:molybdopterin cytidylyltransferase MocA